MTKAIVAFLPGRGAVHGALDVYRDPRDGEEAYVLVGRIGGARRALAGPGNVEMAAHVVVRAPSRAALEAEQRLQFARDPERYTKLCGAFGVDDKIEHAPELPEELQEVVDREFGISRRVISTAHLRALPERTDPSESFDPPSTADREGPGFVTVVVLEEVESGP